MLVVAPANNGGGGGGGGGKKIPYDTNMFKLLWSSSCLDALLKRVFPANSVGSPRLLTPESVLTCPLYGGPKTFSEAGDSKPIASVAVTQHVFPLWSALAGIFLDANSCLSCGQGLSNGVFWRSRPYVVEVESWCVIPLCTIFCWGVFLPFDLVVHGSCC